MRILSSKTIFLFSIFLLQPIGYAKEIFICQLPSGKAVYTSYPQGKCQLSEIDGVSSEDEQLIKLSNQQKIFYEKEFGSIAEVELPPPSSYIIKVDPQKSNSAPQAKSIKENKYLEEKNFKSLIQRDIFAEKSALEKAEKEFLLAKKNKQLMLISELERKILGHKKNIEAFQDELINR